MPTRKPNKDEPAKRTGTSKREPQFVHRCQRFVEVAERLFLERGFAGTSVNEVVRVAGGSLATLYAEFGTKEELFAAVMNRRAAQMFANVHGPGKRRGATLQAELLQLAKRLQDHMFTPDALAIYRLAIHEGPNFPAVRNAVLESGLGGCLGRLAEYFATLEAEGRLVTGNHRLAAEDFLILVQGKMKTIAACGGAEGITARRRGERVRHAVEAFLKIYPPAR